MVSDILKSIIDLINTSPDHNAWLDEHLDKWLDESGEVTAGIGDGMPRIHITGPVVDTWHPSEIDIDGITLKIGPHRFDLNDPKSIDRIEEMFGCDLEKEPNFNPIDVIGDMIHE